MSPLLQSKAYSMVCPQPGEYLMGQILVLTRLGPKPIQLRVRYRRELT